MNPDAPTRLSPYLVWRNLVDAIRAGTDLHPPEDDPFATDNQPAPLMHRQFSVEPGNARYHGRCAPDEALNKRQRVLVTLRHDYDPGQHEASWSLAAADFERLEDAVLTRIEAFRVLQPTPLESTARRVGHHIVQTLAIEVDYSRRLPPLSGA